MTPVRGAGRREWIAFVILTAGCCLHLAGQPSPAPGGPAPAGTEAAHPKVNLLLRIANGKTAFHPGEIVPVELIYSSPEQGKVLFPEDCGGHGTYQFHATPEGLVDRAAERDAAGLGDGSGMGCHGWRPDSKDLSEKPFIINLLLNNWFRMETPGNYKVAVTAYRSGFGVTSEPVDLEILPPDPAWEKLTLAHAIALMDSSETGMRVEGCQIVSYLPTEEVEREMARRYRARDYCDQQFYAALINAHHRKAVLEELEAGLTRPDCPITPGYLGMLAKVSLYEKHPEWYPEALTKDAHADPARERRSRSGLWNTPGAIQQEEIRYAEILAAAVSRKTGEARAVSLKALLDLDQTFMGGDAAPARFAVLAKQQLPQAFLDLPVIDQSQLLSRDWSMIKSPAMIPVLKQMAKSNGMGPRAEALLRLSELAPDEARPIVMEQIKGGNATYRSTELKRLPDLKFPELDALLLAGIKSEILEGYYFEYKTALLNRYGSAQIAAEVRALVDSKIGTLNGRAEATLIAYFLRVDGATGMSMLRREIAAPGRADYQFLLNLADATTPAYEEQAALMGLDSSDPRMVNDALVVLERFGTAGSARVIRDHFRRAREEWKLLTPGTKEYDESGQAYAEGYYIMALARPNRWLPSAAEIKSLESLCVSQDWRNQVTQLAAAADDPHHEINYQGPSFGGDDFDDEFSLALSGRIVGVGQLEEKLAQFPKGSDFYLKTDFAGYAQLQAVYERVRPWAMAHGYELELKQRKPGTTILGSMF